MCLHLCVFPPTQKNTSVRNLNIRYRIYEMHIALETFYHHNNLVSQVDHQYLLLPE